ncbi:MAG: DUF4115 domain-containing protein [Anaerolineaceae bacterium]|nr:DUF4115 domain-containing protein [Anaerolineaceae bacterium]
MPETIGVRLKKAREDHRLSVEQAAHATKVKVKYLEALENDQRELMPSAVQGRGFLRLYASYLGIETLPLLEAWDSDGVITEAPRPVEPPIKTVSFPSITDEIEPLPVENVDAQDLLSISKQEALNSSVEQTPGQIFAEIGQTLKNRRESLGLKLADIERYTLVRQHYLENLEKGKMTELPSLVQARGMLNNYAHFLELDTEEVLLKFASALQLRRFETQGESAASKNTLSRKHATKAGSWRMLVTPDLLIGGVLVVSLLIFALWSVSQITASQNQEDDPANAMALPPSLLSTAQPLITSTLPPLENTPNPDDDRLQTDTKPTEEMEPTQFISLAPLQLNIVANQRAYLRVVADGKIIFNDRVAPGNAYSFSAENQIEILTGNAGALQVFFNQNDLGILGVANQVSSQIYTLAGIITPTAQFSPTPTETLQPTLTPMPSPTVLTPTVTPFIP